MEENAEEQGWEDEDNPDRNGGLKIVWCGGILMAACVP